MENKKTTLNASVEEQKQAILVLPITDIEVTEYGSVYLDDGKCTTSLYKYVSDLLGVQKLTNVRFTLSITQLDNEQIMTSDFITSDFINKEDKKEEVTE